MEDVSSLLQRIAQLEAELSDAPATSVTDQVHGIRMTSSSGRQGRSGFTVQVPAAPSAHNAHALPCDSDEVTPGIKDSVNSETSFSSSGSSIKAGLSLSGIRTPEHYLSAINMTIKARREARGWRKIAYFWKSAARRGISGIDILSPSPSDLSETPEGLPGPCVAQTSVLLDRLQASSHQPDVAHASQAVEPSPLSTGRLAASDEFFGCEREHTIRSRGLRQSVRDAYESWRC